MVKDGSQNCCIQAKMYRLYRKRTNFVWIQHVSLANRGFALILAIIVLKRLWYINRYTALMTDFNRNTVMIRKKLK